MVAMRPTVDPPMVIRSFPAPVLIVRSSPTADRPANSTTGTGLLPSDVIQPTEEDTHTVSRPPPVVTDTAPRIAPTKVTVSPSLPVPVLTTTLPSTFTALPSSDVEKPTESSPRNPVLIRTSFRTVTLPSIQKESVCAPPVYANEPMIVGAVASPATNMQFEPSPKSADTLPATVTLPSATKSLLRPPTTVTAPPIRLAPIQSVFKLSAEPRFTLTEPPTLPPIATASSPSAVVTVRLPGIENVVTPAATLSIAVCRAATSNGASAGASAKPFRRLSMNTLASA